MTANISTSQALFPEKLECLFRPKRYKILYGGRGGAKSWGIARALLIQGTKKHEPLRILCTREVQKSIKESVHQLLKDQIEALGLEHFYRVLETEIIGENGTKFTFSGLSDKTSVSIKSYEGYDIFWVEEAQTVSEKSWRILAPTARKSTVDKNGKKRESEVWISFNPDLDTDPTYQRFVVNPPPESFVVFVNYYDNPWFPEVLEKERLHCKKTDPDNYDNIWEGRCRPAAEGTIYYKQMVQAEADGRIGHFPYDPMLKVHVVTDLGYMDNMFIALVQRNQSAITIIKAIQGGYPSLDKFSAYLKSLDLNWGRYWLPHDGFSKHPHTGKSSQEILQALGWDVPDRAEIVELSVEDGIKATQNTFSRFYLNKPECEPIIEAAKRYRRRKNVQTDYVGTPLPDQYAHGADTLRYIALNAENMSNESYQVVQQAAPVGNWRAL
jgi:phage terminase large subunit